MAVRPLKFWGEILLVHENILYIYYIYIYIYNFHDVICSFITANHDVIRVLSIFWYQSPGRKTKARTPERRQLLTLDQKCDVAKSMHKQMTEDLKRAKDISERELDNYKVISQERERERASSWGYYKFISYAYVIDSTLFRQLWKKLISTWRRLKKNVGSLIVILVKHCGIKGVWRWVLRRSSDTLRIK